MYVCVCQHFQISSPLKSKGLTKAKFHMESPWDGGTKVSNGPGHMTKVATMPIYGKNLWNQKADDHLETWYAASGPWVLPSLFK